jgi:ABC-type dipeptide/oligopeptide/nickel transport system permease component
MSAFTLTVAIFLTGGLLAVALAFALGYALGRDREKEARWREQDHRSGS